MRDISYRTGSFVRVYTRVHSPFGCKADEISTFTSSGLTQASARSNVIKSDGIKATPYTAYRLSINPVSLDVLGKQVGARYFCRNRWVRPDHKGTGFHYGFHAGSCPNLAYISVSNASTGTIQPVIHAPTSTDCQNALLQGLSRQNVNFGNALGEARESGEFLLSKLAALLKFLRAIMRRDLTFIRKFIKSKSWRPKTWANAWLELKYAWLPLMSDVYNARQSIVDAFENAASDKPFKVFAQASNTESFDYWPTSVSRVKGSVTWTCKGAVYYIVNEPSLRRLQMLGLTNPFAVAWELVPFSFVLDWVYDVGSFLNGLTSTHGLKFLSGYLSHRSECTSVFETYTDWSLWKFQEGTPGGCEVKASAFRRQTLGSFPKAGVSISFDLNLNQVTSLMALLTQKA